MKLVHPLRITLAGIFSVALAAVLAAQSAGITLTRKEPETALMLFPSNGLAQENLAAAIFEADLVVSREAEGAAQTAKPSAFASYLSEPLTPEVHAILALTQGRREVRSEVISRASELDKRETMLQGLVLQEYVNDGNYTGVITTLDRILRVRPSRSTELFPVLSTVFVQDGATEQFAGVLNGTSPWHEEFLSYAVRQDAALANLARLRRLITFGNVEIDKALLRNLVREGKVETGYGLYDEIFVSTNESAQVGLLQWDSDFVPFDWRFADGADFRAQRNLDSDQLQLYVRAGQGGIFARRIIKAPEGPFTVSAQHEIKPQELADDVRLFLRCTDDPQPFFEARFGAARFQQLVNDIPSECSFIEVQLHARAWSGKSALRGLISPLRITQ
ncbi:hypothetical protein K3165_02320 [Qipengyuania sp. 1XM1-15A]|uniref:hypothetical protein n=1 Tax=Qipengyuania xiamenensis TaxID=2867237 RepID=UPI001C874C47|nr:hypothetical protein [Qipengyuania xiamenensis]MBX7531755.1 hypothetical protein [Qipengyuania xiamenensis]